MFKLAAHKIKARLAILIVAYFCVAINHATAQELVLFESEIQLIEYLDSIHNEATDSPADNLLLIPSLLDYAILKNWRKAQLHVKLKEAELLLRDKNDAAAEQVVKEIDKMSEVRINTNTLIRINLVKLQIAKITRDRSGIEQQQQWLIAQSYGLSDMQLKATLLHTVGEKYNQLEEYEKAIKYISEAHTIATQLGDESTIVNNLNSLANVYSKLNDSQSALRYYRMAYEYMLQNDNHYALSIIQYNMGYAHYSLKEFDKAESLYLQAIASGEKAEFEAIIAYAKQQLGQLKLENQEWQAVLELYPSVMEFYERTGNDVYHFFASKALAEASLGLKDYAMAEEYLERCSEILERSDTPSRRISLNNLKSKVAFEQGQLEKAYVILQDNLVLQDKVFNDRLEQQAQKHKIAFDTELVQNQNAVLLENEALNEKIILEQNKQRNVFILLIVLFVTVILLVIWNLVRQVKVRNKFHKLAMLDPLTSAPNRRNILNIAKSELAKIRRSETDNATALVIAIIDLDNFKQLNDTYGHETGDRALCAFALACKDSIREGEYFGRYGGEEWLFVFNNVDEAGLHAFFKRIKDRLSLQEIVGFPLGQQLTFSMGATNYDPDKDRSIAELIARADVQLYQAKAKGRDCLALELTHNDKASQQVVRRIDEYKSAK